MSVSNQQLQQALSRGAARYFDECREKVPGFVATHFNLPGAWHTNKHALGWDLLKAPLNLFWAPLYLLLCLLGFVCRRIGWSRAAKILARTPGGLSTQVQRNLTRWICYELLQQPSVSRHSDQLTHCMLEELEDLAAQQGWDPRQLPELQQALAPVVTDALKQYAITRTASSDITNSLLSTVIGAFAFQKYTPGGLAIGFSVAALMANELAAKEFILGETLGSVYYSIFPASPSFSVTAGSMVAVLTLLATFASLSGLLTDPLQSGFGLHQRRLNRLLDHLERDLQDELSSQFGGPGQGSYRPKDQYLARLMDLIDAAKSHLT